MTLIDAEDLVHRIQRAYAGEVMRRPLAEITGESKPLAADTMRPARRARQRRWAMAVAGAAAVAVTLLFLAGPLGSPPVGDPSVVAAQRCAAKVLDVTRDAASLPAAERGRVPSTRLTVTVESTDVFLYATEHAVITCAAHGDGSTSTALTPLENGIARAGKLQPLLSDGDGRVNWALGFAPDNALTITVVLSGDRTVAAVHHDGLYLAAWTGAPEQVIRLEATTDGGSLSWGPAD